MKKLVGLLILSVLVLGTMSLAFADQVVYQECDDRGSRFIDENEDGVCDHQEDRRFNDQDGDGICDNARNGSCEFIDEDGDGINDLRGRHKGSGHRGNRGGRK